MGESNDKNVLNMFMKCQDEIHHFVQQAYAIKYKSNHNRWKWRKYNFCELFPYKTHIISEGTEDSILFVVIGIVTVSKETANINLLPLSQKKEASQQDHGHLISEKHFQWPLTTSHTIFSAVTLSIVMLATDSFV